MLVDIIIIIFWWLVFLSLGAIFLPLSFKIFRIFCDRGYIFSKIIAIGCVSYLVWIFGELKILSFSRFNIWALLLILAVINLLIVKAYIRDFIDIFKQKYKIFIFEEAIFFVTLFIFSIIRGFEPRIEGLEKFMDFGFINSILRAEYFPPKDMWLAGSNINYYYFGHLIAAVLTKISGISSYVTYNLTLSLIYALTFTATFSLALNFIYLSFFKNGELNLENNALGIIKKIFNKKTYLIIGGILSAITLTLAGNFQTIYFYLTHNFSFADYWYPDAVRFIPNTIHDFPMYSFATGYFHELISLPFILLVIASIFVLYTEEFELDPKKKSTLFLPVFLGLFLGMLYIINTADWAIYVLFLSMLVCVVNYHWYDISLAFVKKTAFFLLVTVGSSVIFILPFLREFEPFVKGVALAKDHSSLFQLFVLWGFYLFMGLSFILLLMQGFKKKNKELSLKEGSIISQRSLKINFVDFFVLAMIIFSATLIIVPEIIYMRDIYEGGQPRANTMYKLVYQSWMMMGTVTGYIFICWLFWQKKITSFLWGATFIIAFGAVIIYPYFSLRSYYHDLRGYKGLSGADWLIRLYPDDYVAIEWINRNIQYQPVIVEAAQDDFTYYGRVSANTGLVNIVNWVTHEWLWRGSYTEAGKRKEEVKLIYESANLAEIKNLLKKYNVEYIFVGSLERSYYTNLNEANLSALGQVVFNFGQTKIYKVYKN